MKTRRPLSVLVLAAIGGIALAARADEPEAAEEPAEAPAKDFGEYQERLETTCVGPLDGKQAEPTVYDIGGYHYSVDAWRANVKRTTARKGAGIRLGIINATKDDTAETQANVAEYIARFKAEDVDGIVIGGDTSYGEDEMVAILDRIAATDLPIYAVIGNAESKGAWNRGTREVWKKHQNLLNLDFVRLVRAEGFDIASMPGYYDKRYSSTVGPCIYTTKELKQFPKLVEGLDGPVIALSHGPPRQSAKFGIDFVPQAGNVGDPDFATALTKANIQFGIFGHIVESGGHATDASGKKEIKPLTFSDSLFLNPGSANSAPWRMNTGPESYGMASILYLEGKKAKYEIIHSKQRFGKGPI